MSRIEAGETIELVGIAITRDDLLLQRNPLPGKIVASEGDVTVVLDTTLTDALRMEGLAREMNSVLQQARKNAGLEVTDRVRVLFDSDDQEVIVALETNAKSIADEVLAVEFRRDAAANQSDDLNGKLVRYTLSKA